MEESRIISACGNDCKACPRYAIGKINEDLLKTAELWYRIGYRDRVVSVEEISCHGCKPENWCRYNVVKCCAEKRISNCGECAEYPCDNIKKCFEVTKSFEPKCREVCTEAEYRQIEKAFFNKEQNLNNLKHNY